MIERGIRMIKGVSRTGRTAFPERAGYFPD